MAAIGALIVAIGRDEIAPPPASAPPPPVVVAPVQPLPMPLAVVVPNNNKESAMENVVATLNAPDVRARISAALALGMSNDRRAVVPLCGCLDDEVETTVVRLACASALVKLKKPGSVECLREHRDHWDEKLREHVEHSLARSGPELAAAEIELQKQIDRLDTGVEVQIELGYRDDHPELIWRRKRLATLIHDLSDVREELAQIGKTPGLTVE